MSTFKPFRLVTWCAMWPVFIVAFTMWPVFIVAFTFAALIEGPMQGHSAWCRGFEVLVRGRRA